MVRPPTPSPVLGLAAILGFLLSLPADPARAGGSNISDPAPTPDTPDPVIVSDDQRAGANVGDPADCAQQLDNQGIVYDTGTLAAATAATALDAAGLAAEVIGEAGQPFTNAATVAGVGIQATGVAVSIADLVFQGFKLGIDVEANGLPNCDQAFIGTVQVRDGGVDVSGGSIFNDDVGVDADVNASGEVTANQVKAAQGISAHGGAIWLGDPDPDGTSPTYSSGITIGGGAISGAGTGGEMAFTGDVDAIAIGNGATAMTAGSVAIGLSSTANGEEDVVVGAFNTTGTGGNNTVVGNEIDIIGDDSSNNTVLGVGHQVTGSRNFVGGDPNTVVGSANVATGVDSTVTGDSNVAIGDTVTVIADRAVAVGNGTIANAADTTVIGTGARAAAEGAAAFGQGAVALQSRQQVFGTAANTYTTPGITSALSRARQAGGLEVATSDAFGNLATDGGEIFETLSENRAGVAIAMAVESPDLADGERFAFAMNWGVFESSHGLGVSGIAVLANDLLGTGERLSFQGGFGLSVSEETYGGRNASAVFGGRAGLQFSW